MKRSALRWRPALSRIFRMRRVAGVVAFSCLAGVVGCGGVADWNTFVSFRVKNDRLVPPTHEPTEAAEAFIASELHYARIDLESFFFRDLKGYRGLPLIVGLEVKGVIPGKTIKSVFDLSKEGYDKGLTRYASLGSIEPFLYKGDDIVVTLHLRTVAPSDTKGLAAQIEGAADFLKRLDPQRARERGFIGTNLFESTFTPLRPAERSWRYSFTFRGADRVYRDKSELLFGAGRYVIVALPPSGDRTARGLSRKVSEIPAQLRIQNDRVVHVGSEEEYVGTPHLVLNITRYRRYPKPDTAFRKASAELRNLVEAGNTSLVRGTIPNLRILLSQDAYLSTREKNLERARLDAIVAELSAMEARRTQNGDAELRAVKNWMDHLFLIGRECNVILEPHEREDLLFQIRSLGQRAKEVELALGRTGAIAEKVDADLKALREHWTRDNEEIYLAPRVTRAIEPEARAPVARKPAVSAPAPATAPATVSTPASAPGPVSTTAPAFPAAPAPATGLALTPTPLHKKWWFWTAIGGGVATVTTVLILVLSRKTITPVTLPEGF
jgi:hypothetical protein